MTRVHLTLRAEAALLSLRAGPRNTFAVCRAIADASVASTAPLMSQLRDLGLVARGESKYNHRWLWWLTDHGASHLRAQGESVNPVTVIRTDVMTKEHHVDA